MKIYAAVCGIVFFIIASILLIRMSNFADNGDLANALKNGICSIWNYITGFASLYLASKIKTTK